MLSRATRRAEYSAEFRELEQSSRGVEYLAAKVDLYTRQWIIVGHEPRLGTVILSSAVTQCADQLSPPRAPCQHS